MPLPQNKVFIIDDFSPGIVSNVGTAIAGQRLGPGIAQETNTYRCIALPGGGLSPLPKSKSSFTIPTPLATTFMNNTIRVVGIETIGRVYPSTGLIVPQDGDEIHIGIEWALSASPNHLRFAWYAIRAQDNNATLLTTISTTQSAGVSLIPTPFFTTLTRLQSPGARANVSLCASWEDHLGGNANTWFYPDPANPSSSVPLVFNRSGMVFAHEGRVLQFDNRIESHGPSLAYSNNFVNFTAPPLSTRFGDQGFPIEPTIGSIGAVASLGQQGFLVISVADGAVLVVGDLVNTMQTILQKSVHGTGMTIQKALVSPIGVVYCTETGAYVWDGQTSTCISKQLKSSFCIPVNLVPRSLEQTYVTMGLWNDYILFPRNYMYDINLKSWWRIEDASLVDMDLVASSKTRSGDVFGVPNAYIPGGSDQIKLFSSNFTVAPTYLASSYSWQSHPIPVSDRRWIDVREIEIVATPSSGTISTITITLTALDGTTQTEVFTLTETRTMRLRKPTSCKGYNIVFRIEANSNGANSAPIVHSVALGYHDAQTSAAA